MSVRSAESVTKVFTLRNFSTGAAANATGTPTGTLYVNGISNAASVTVTNITTGVYFAAVTLPTLAAGDLCDLVINATVSGVTDNTIIWSDTKDLVLDSSYRPDTNLELWRGVQPTALSAAGNVSSSIAEIAGDNGSSAFISYWQGLVHGSVDASTFTPTTTVFETSITEDSDNFTGNQILWTLTPDSDNGGAYSTVLSYSFSGNNKVKLTLAAPLPSAIQDTDTFVMVGIAPDNASIAAIKAKTDNLPTSPAAVGSVMTIDATTVITDVASTSTLGGILSILRALANGKMVCTTGVLQMFGTNGTTQLGTTRTITGAVPADFTRS